MIIGWGNLYYHQTPHPQTPHPWTPNDLPYEGVCSRLRTTVIVVVLVIVVVVVVVEVINSNSNSHSNISSKEFAPSSGAPPALRGRQGGLDILRAICIYIYIYIYTCVYACIYIYVYMYRERERHRSALRSIFKLRISEFGVCVRRTLKRRRWVFLVHRLIS